MPDELHVCDQCECTMTARLVDLTSKHGWRKYTGTSEPVDGIKQTWSLLLCGDCKPDKPTT